MKIKILLFLTLIVIVMSSFPNYETKDNIFLENSENNKSLSIMLQNENGEYQEGDSSFNKAEYRFNKKLSRCVNGSKILYNESDYSLIVKTTKSDRCYAYFDNNNFVEDLSGNGNYALASGSILRTSEGVKISSGAIESKLNYNQLSDNFSIVLRFRVDREIIFDSENDNYYSIFGTRDGFASFWMFTRQNNIFPYFQIYNKNGGHTSAIGYNIERNKFYTIIGTYDNKIMKYYNNGQIQSQQTLSGDMAKSNLTFCLFLGNTFSDILIFNRTLSEEEITNDYKDIPNPTNKKDLLLWYKFA